MDNVYKVSNFLLPEELAEIESLLNDQEPAKELDANLGRVMYFLPLSDSTLNNIKSRVETLTGQTLSPMNSIFTDYDSQYGQPNLPPHFDGDTNSLIIDYQYKSNTSWGLGVDEELFDMQDNDALIFNPNEYPHWRPEKTFKEGEFVTMAFFRFPDSNIDYSHMIYSQDHPIFDKALKARKSAGD